MSRGGGNGCRHRREHHDRQQQGEDLDIPDMRQRHVQQAQHQRRAALLEQAHVALASGDGFGAPGYARLSFAAAMENLEEGLKRLEKFLGGK